MNVVKKYMLALLVSVTATAVQAGDNRVSLFHCGLLLGGTVKAFGPQPAASKGRQYVSSELLRTVDARLPDTSPFADTKLKDVGRRRLPRAITVAKVGCSWR